MMIKDLIKISILTLLLASAACQKSSSSGTGGTSFFGDDTAKAVELVSDANNDLKEIKKIYKDNQGKVADLQDSITKDPTKVKSIAGDLADQITKGQDLGKSAVKKINDAEGLNINSDFKKYLSMKEDSLQKLLGAFDARREAAGILRDKFGTTNNPETIKQVKAAFKEQIDKSDDLMQDGQQTSLDANDFAKNVLRKAQ